MNLLHIYMPIQLLLWQQLRQQEERADRARRGREGELNLSEFRAMRKNRAFRQRYERRETAESHDRATRLRDWEQGLDAWPDVHLSQAFEAIREFRDDHDDDPAHWVDLR